MSSRSAEGVVARDAAPRLASAGKLAVRTVWGWALRRMSDARARHRSWRVRRLSRKYVAAGRKPGQPGYGEHKLLELQRAAADEELLRTFARNEPLPDGHGVGLDERLVEYLWVLARLGEGRQTILDAGSTLNFEWIASHPRLRHKAVVVYNLAPEGTLPHANYSYVYGDLRSTILKSECLDLVVCISTLEHVGMDNTVFYTHDTSYQESAPEGCRRVMAEFNRVLVPGGRVLLTVPFGRYQDFGWFRQFDANALQEAIAAFDGALRQISYFKYTESGWVRADAESCRDCEFLHVSDGASRPRVVSARAVACVELEK